MNQLSTASTDQLLTELLTRLEQPQSEPADPLHRLVVDYARERAINAQQYVSRAEEEARREAAERTQVLLNVLRTQPEEIVVSVSISDPWDNSYTGSTRGSVSVTDQGLKRALAKAESEHARAAGNVRTDGVLGYRVTAQLPGGLSVEVPDEIWLPYSQQTAESMAERREQDARRFGASGA